MALFAKRKASLIFNFQFSIYLHTRSVVRLSTLNYKNSPATSVTGAFFVYTASLSEASSATASDTTSASAGAGAF